jgi:cytidine deaminase
MAIPLKIGRGFPHGARELLELARKTGDNAYNPYSGYLVGAAAETDGGERFSGTFMENASYGLTICAEPAAILAANSSGYRDVRTMAVVGGNPTDTAPGNPCTPCGRCRQMLFEAAAVSGREIEIYCADLTLTNILLVTSGELLPFAWGADAIGRHGPARAALQT